MTTFNTGNPIGSVDPRDLYVNAENMDTAVNTRAEKTWADRLGVNRKTFYGMESQFDDSLADQEDRFAEALKGIGYERIGDYEAGLEVKEYNQIFRRENPEGQWEWYMPSPDLELPYTLTGDWETDGDSFVSVGDAALRNELAGEGGAGLVGLRSPVGAYPIKSIQHAIEISPYPITWFAKGDGTDETEGIQAAIDSGQRVIDGLGMTFKVSQIDCPSNITLKNFNFIKIPSDKDHVNVLNWESFDPEKPVTNVFLSNVHIYGSRDQEKDVGVSPTENGGRSGFRFRGFVDGVYMKNCSASYCGTDGLIIFVGGIARPNNPLGVKNFYVEGCTFDWNRRHGISGDSLKNVKFIEVKAQNNGLNLPVGTWSPYDGGHGDWVGSEENPELYGNGCDIESYGPENHSEDLYFTNCDMRYNARGGLLLLEVRPELNEGLKQWKNINISGGIYNKGMNSVDNSAIYIGVNGVNQDGFIPDTNFVGVEINTNTGSDMIIFRRVYGNVTMLHTPEPSESFTVASFLIRSKGTITLSDKDRYFVDSTSNLTYVNRVKRERPIDGSERPYVYSEPFSGNVAISGTTSSALIDYGWCKKFMITASLDFPDMTSSSVISIRNGAYKYIEIEDLILTTSGGHKSIGDSFVFGQTDSEVRIAVQASSSQSGLLRVIVRAMG